MGNEGIYSVGKEFGKANKLFSKQRVSWVLRGMALIVRKILRSLPKRFHAKIIAIEEVKDIDQLPLTELVGNLQTYEIGLGSMGKCGKSKNLALKGIEEEIEDSEDEDESEDEDKDLTFITDEIIKLL